MNIFFFLYHWQILPGQLKLFNNTGLLPNWSNLLSSDTIDSYSSPSTSISLGRKAKSAPVQVNCTAYNIIQVKQSDTDGRVYSCAVCDYSCKQKSHIDQHARVHTGEKPYKCTYCDYRSTTKSNITKHEQNKHQQLPPPSLLPPLNLN